MAAASCEKLQVVDFAASGRCKWPAATGSCKCPYIWGSVQTRSLQVDLLQVPIHPLDQLFKNKPKPALTLHIIFRSDDNLDLKQFSIQIVAFYFYANVKFSCFVTLA